MRTMSAKVVGIGLVSLCYGAIAQAQDLGGYYPGTAFNGLVTNQTAITQATIGRNATRATQGDPALQSKHGAEASAASAHTSFKAPPARRQADYAQFVAKSCVADPESAAGLAATLKSDPIAQMGPELAKYGLRTDDVADAYTVYWTEAWAAAHGVTREDSREQAQAVRRQAAAAILATSEFARATDAQKQEFADALLVQALLVAAAVRQGAKATGLDLDAMTLTDEGLVPAK